MTTKTRLTTEQKHLVHLDKSQVLEDRPNSNMGMFFLDNTYQPIDSQGLVLLKSSVEEWIATACHLGEVSTRNEQSQE
jgi:hypothetical protein